MKKTLPLIIAAIAIFGASCSSSPTTTITVDEDGNVVAVNGDAIPVEADGGIGDGADPLPEPEPAPEPEPEPEPEPQIVANWDWDQSIEWNAANLVGKPVDDALRPIVDDMDFYLNANGYSVNERYWASYVAWADVGCAILIETFDRGVVENWGVYRAEIEFNAVLDSAVDYMKTTTTGFGTLSLDERQAILAAAYFTGGCEDVYFTFEEFIYGVSYTSNSSGNWSA